MPKVHRYASAAYVEHETAANWAKRARECWTRYVDTGRVEWLVRAERYRDEALEHAAMVEDYGKTVGTIQRLLDEIWGRK